MLKKNMFFHVILSVLIFLIMLLMQQKTEAFAQRCSLKKVLLEISQKLNGKAPVLESLF